MTAADPREQRHSKPEPAQLEVRSDAPSGPDLDRLAELEQAATPGPWEEMCLGSEGYQILHREDGRLRPDRVARLGQMDWDSDKANAELLPALRNAAPDLIAAARERDQLRATVERATKLLEYALHLRMYGERAPGGNETWRQFDTDVEHFLRGDR